MKLSSSGFRVLATESAADSSKREPIAGQKTAPLAAVAHFKRDRLRCHFTGHVTISISISRCELPC